MAYVFSCIHNPHHLKILIFRNFCSNLLNLLRKADPVDVQVDNISAAVCNAVQFETLFGDLRHRHSVVMSSIHIPHTDKHHRSRLVGFGKRLHAVRGTCTTGLRVMAPVSMCLALLMISDI